MIRSPRLLVAGLAATISSSVLCFAAQHAPPTASPRVEAAASERPSWSDAAIDAYVASARTDALARCASLGIALPADFLAWIDGDRMLRMSVYGCRADPLPVLLGLRSLEIDLGSDVVRREYPQLAIAFAIQDSYAKRGPKGTPWNDADGAAAPDRLPDVSPRAPLTLTIPGDPRERVDTKSRTRALDRDDHIINFLEDHAAIEVEVPAKALPPLEYDEHGIAKPRGTPDADKHTIRRPLVAADVIASRELQVEFNAYMAAHGHPDTSIDCGDGAVRWYSTEAVNDAGLRTRIKAAHDLFHDAYRAKGRMPRERDAAPTPSESMAWFIRNDRERLASSAGADARKHPWPMFPLNAPWPVLLMLAADDQPLREREEIWVRFRDNDEFRTYGEYIGGIAQQFDMQSARRLSPYPFAYGSIQMMWKDGGVCGTMGNIGARTYRICGVPASTAGQPGHCAMVFMEEDAKSHEFRCKGGQYATGGDDVTTVHAGWNYDDVGGRRPMVYHQSIAWGVNHGFEPFVETLVLRRMWDRLPTDAKPNEVAAFLDASLERSPFALLAIDAAAGGAPDWRATVALASAADRQLDAHTTTTIAPLYRSTVHDRFFARIAKLDAPKSPEESRELLAALEHLDCDDAKLLARTWRGIGGDDEFVARTKAAVLAYLDRPSAAKPNGKAAKREAKEFAAQLKEWSETVKGKDARRAWARELLPLFDQADAPTKEASKSDPPREFVNGLAEDSKPT